MASPSAPSSERSRQADQRHTLEEHVLEKRAPLGTLSVLPEGELCCRITPGNFEERRIFIQGPVAKNLGITRKGVLVSTSATLVPLKHASRSCFEFEAEHGSSGVVLYGCPNFASMGLKAGWELWLGPMRDGGFISFTCKPPSTMQPDEKQELHRGSEDVQSEAPWCQPGRDGARHLGHAARKAKDRRSACKGAMKQGTDEGGGLQAGAGEQRASVVQLTSAAASAMEDNREGIAVGWDSQQTPHPLQQPPLVRFDEGGGQGTKTCLKRKRQQALGEGPELFDGGGSLKTVGGYAVHGDDRGATAAPGVGRSASAEGGFRKHNTSTSSPTSQGVHRTTKREGVVNTAGLINNEVSTGCGSILNNSTSQQWEDAGQCRSRSEHFTPVCPTPSMENSDDPLEGRETGSPDGRAEDLQAASEGGGEGEEEMEEAEAAVFQGRKEGAGSQGGSQDVEEEMAAGRREEEEAVQAEGRSRRVPPKHTKQFVLTESSFPQDKWTVRPTGGIWRIVPGHFVNGKKRILLSDSAAAMVGIVRDGKLVTNVVTLIDGMEQFELSVEDFDSNRKRLFGCPRFFSSQLKEGWVLCLWPIEKDMIIPFTCKEDAGQCRSRSQQPYSVRRRPTFHTSDYPRESVARAGGLGGEEGAGSQGGSQDAEEEEDEEEEGRGLSRLQEEQAVGRRRLGKRAHVKENTVRLAPSWTHRSGGVCRTVPAHFIRDKRINIPDIVAKILGMVNSGKTPKDKMKGGDPLVFTLKRVRDRGGPSVTMELCPINKGGYTLMRCTAFDYLGLNAGWELWFGKIDEHGVLPFSCTQDGYLPDDEAPQQTPPPEKFSCHRLQAPEAAFDDPEQYEGIRVRHLGLQGDAGQGCSILENPSRVYPRPSPITSDAPQKEGRVGPLNDGLVGLRLRSKGRQGIEREMERKGDGRWQMGERSQGGSGMDVEGEDDDDQDADDEEQEEEEEGRGAARQQHDGDNALPDEEMSGQGQGARPKEFVLKANPAPQEHSWTARPTGGAWRRVPSHFVTDKRIIIPAKVAKPLQLLKEGNFQHPLLTLKRVGDTEAPSVTTELCRLSKGRYALTRCTDFAYLGLKAGWVLWLGEVDSQGVLPFSCTEEPPPPPEEAPLETPPPQANTQGCSAEHGGTSGEGGGANDAAQSEEGYDPDAMLRCLQDILRDADLHIDPFLEMEVAWLHMTQPQHQCIYRAVKRAAGSDSRSTGEQTGSAVSKLALQVVNLLHLLESDSWAREGKGYDPLAALWQLQTGMPDAAVPSSQLIAFELTWLQRRTLNWWQGREQMVKRALQLGSDKVQQVLDAVIRKG